MYLFSYTSFCALDMHIQSLVSVLTREDFGGASMEELLGSRYASPFVQAALKGAAMLQGNRCVCVCVCVCFMFKKCRVSTTVCTDLCASGT